MTKVVHPQTHPDAVNAIRRLRAAGYPIARLAEHFGVARQTVSRIVHYKTHANVVDIGEPLEVYEPIKTKPRAKSPAPDNTLQDLVSRYKSTLAPSATPTPTPPAATPSPSPTPPPGSRPGDVRREPSPEPPPRPSTGGYSAWGFGGTPKGGF